MYSRIIEKIKNNETLRNSIGVILFMKKSGVRIKFFASSVGLSLILTLISTYTVSLLFPLVDGIIKGNFENIKDLKIIGWIITKYPETFSTSLKLFLLLILWLYITIIIKSILQYLSSLATQYQAKNATINLRNQLMDTCLNLGKSFYDKNKIIQIHETVTRSASTIENQFKIFHNFIVQFFFLITNISIMLFISWKLAIISVISFPIANFFTKKIIRSIRESLRYSNETTVNLNNKVMDILYCMPLVKGFSKEIKEKEIFSNINNKEIQSFFKRQKLNSLLNPIEEIGTTTSILLLAIGIAFMTYIDNSIDSSKTFVFFYLAQKIIPGMNIFNNFKLGLLNSQKRFDDINNLLKNNPNLSVPEGKELLENVKNIDIRNLSFSYQDTIKPALENISISIPKGKTTAIVGPTGSGKSTLLSLLLRFYDCPPNTIFINDIDIRRYKINSLRKKISFVSQDVLLFAETIEHNITYGSDKEIDIKKVEDIGKMTKINDFIKNLPEGYKTKIEERGNGFSGGEKQRMAIARALLKDHEIFIMDEGTSALDGNTEQDIMDNIKDILKGKTQIIISHRLSTIKNADQIIYIDNGKVKEAGTLKEILNLKGEFYRQWENQKI